MRLSAIVAALIPLLWLPSGLAQSDPNIASTGPKTPAEERKALHLPPGFEIQLVAAEPDIHKPLNIAFDARGRLWVTDTVEYPFAARGPRPRDTVKILEDFGPDGRARKITTYADGLNIPIGVLPLAHGAMVYSIPNIYRLTGDSKADRRDLLYGAIGFRDTHGMTNNFTWGFDGWVYACHGYANASTIKGGDGQPIRLQSGNVYRMKPDGSHVEQFTHGQVNPFGLAFDPMGDLWSADCHTKPVMMLLRGGYYESFGKPHDGLGFAPEICDHDHGSTAIAGIVYYDAVGEFPAEYRDTVFVGNVVTNRINHDRLERHGSTSIARELPDFLKSDDPWFRPVDLKLGPDGAMYLADFYNRIIGHYEVPLDHPGRDRERGRIWRIIYRGLKGELSVPAPPADLTKEKLSELLDRLCSPNITVRTMAANELVERGRKNASDLKQLEASLKVPAVTRLFPWVPGIWVLERLGVLDESTLRMYATQKDAMVRVHALRILAERKTLSDAERKLVLDRLKDRDAFVQPALKDSDAFVQRAAADALGQHPSPDNLRPLLDLRHEAPADDTQLIHTVRMALRNQLRPDANWDAVASVTKTEQDTRAIADVALGVPSARSADFLLGRLEKGDAGIDAVRSVHHVARFGNVEQPKLIVLARERASSSLDSQLAFFKAVQQGAQEAGKPLSKPGQQWALELSKRLLGSANPRQVTAGIELAGMNPIDSAIEQDFIRLASGRGGLEQHRVAAITALANADARKHVALFGKILDDAGERITIREHAANTLARVNLPEAQAILAQGLPTAPARLQSVMALGLAASKEGAAKLLDLVAAGKASARLLKERPVELRLADSKIPDVKERLAKLTNGLPAIDPRMAALLKSRHDAFAKARTDTALGAKVFEKHCAICHQLGGKGAKIGPQLDGVGIRGIDRLLEDILDPNRNVDQAFRSTTLGLTNGQIVSGLLLKEEGEVYVLADQQGKEVRVPKKDVEEKSQSQLSPMPANQSDQITEADFYHLLAYLLEQRVKEEKKP
jgi:putative heme-binding domain-containing protein